MIHEFNPFLSADCYCFIEYKSIYCTQWSPHPLHNFHTVNYNQNIHIQANPLAINRQSELFEFLTSFIRPSSKCKVCVSLY
jgi:hypothetical protein